MIVIVSVKYSAIIKTVFLFGLNSTFNKKFRCHPIVFFQACSNSDSMPVVGNNIHRISRLDDSLSSVIFEASAENIILHRRLGVFLLEDQCRRYPLADQLQRHGRSFTNLGTVRTTTSRHHNSIHRPDMVELGSNIYPLGQYLRIG